MNFLSKCNFQALTKKVKQGEVKHFKKYRRKANMGVLEHLEQHKSLKMKRKFAFPGTEKQTKKNILSIWWDIDKICGASHSIWWNKKKTIKCETFYRFTIPKCNNLYFYTEFQSPPFHVWIWMWRGLKYKKSISHK